MKKYFVLFKSELGIEVEAPDEDEAAMIADGSELIDLLHNVEIVSVKEVTE